MKKLALHKETLRVIQAQDTQLAGGLFPDPQTSPINQLRSIFGCNTRTCTWCAQSMGDCYTEDFGGMQL